MDCDKVDSACTVGSWASGLRSRRRTSRLTVDSACYGELTDYGFAFAVMNALSTEDSYSTWTKGTCSASTCMWGSFKEVVTDFEGCDRQQLHFFSLEKVTHMRHIFFEYVFWSTR